MATTTPSPPPPSPNLTLNMDSLPAMLPPPGFSSNFIDPVSLHPIVLGVSISTMILLLLIVSIRIFTRLRLLRSPLQFSDVFCLLATAGILAWDGIYIHVSYSGLSRHLWDVPLSKISHFAWMSYLAEISYAITMWAAKQSILCQLKTLFCPDSLSHRRLFTAVARREYSLYMTRKGHTSPIFWALDGLMLLNGGYGLASLFTFIWQCTPREKAWDLMTYADKGSCINIAAATVVGGVVNLVLDLGILVIPIWATWRLKLSVKRRMGISAVFGVGAVTCAIAAVGVAVRVPLLWDGDLTWIIARVGICTMVEYFGTILVGCMPSFPRFFLFLRGREPSTITTATEPSKPVHSQNSSSNRRSAQTQTPPNPSPIQVEIEIQIPRPSLQKPSAVYYSHSPVGRNSSSSGDTTWDFTTSRKDSGYISTSGGGGPLARRIAAGMGLGLALSTSEASLPGIYSSRRSGSDDQQRRRSLSLSLSRRGCNQTRPDQDDCCIELEEGRYSHDNGGHVGYASSLSGAGSTYSGDIDGSRIDDGDSDEEAGYDEVIQVGNGRHSPGEYYDEWDEYWAESPPKPVGRVSL